MQRFFDRPDTHWRRLSGALHFYVMPPAGGELLAAHERVCAALAVFPGLTAQPAEYVHMTLQRLDAYMDEVDADAWAGFEGALAARLARRAPFVVDYAPPAPNGQAIEAIGRPTPAWQEVVADIRDALSASGFGGVLTPAPYGPHYTNLYCTSATDDDQVSEVLRGVGEPTRMTVTEVALVAVDQHPEQGIFAFETLARWPLGRGR